VVTREFTINEQYLGLGLARMYREIGPESPYGLMQDNLRYPLREVRLFTMTGRDAESVLGPSTFASNLDGEPLSSHQVFGFPGFCTP
jgi:hypothetical protein